MAQNMETSLDGRESLNGRFQWFCSICAFFRSQKIAFVFRSWQFVVVIQCLLIELADMYVVVMGMPKNHVFIPNYHEVRFSLNVWIGTLANRLLGLVVLPNRLTSVGYLNCLQNAMGDLFDELPLNERQQMWFQWSSAFFDRS